MSNEIVERRCRRSPTGIEDCVGSATGGTGSGGIGPEGPEGPPGPTGATGADGEGFTPEQVASLSEFEESNIVTEDATVTESMEIAIPENTVVYFGFRITGTTDLGVVYVKEWTAVYKRIAAAAPVEMGIHDSYVIREVEDSPAWDTEYAVNGTSDGIITTVTGQAATQISWKTKCWFDVEPID